MKRRVLSESFIFIGFFLVFVIFFIHISTFTGLTTHTSSRISEEITMSELDTRSSWDPPLLPRVHLAVAPIHCDRSHQLYDICSINGPAVLDPSSATFYDQGPLSPAHLPIVEKIRPYPRKRENHTMSRIREITLTSGPIGPKCQAQHNAPALVFSAGGYTGNFWHDLNDGFLPLFITVNSIFPDRDFVLVVSKPRDWWVRKWAKLIRTFTKHPVVNLDNDTSSHCFTSAYVGLMTHGFMEMDSKIMPKSQTLKHFQSLLKETFASKVPTQPKSGNRPRLLLMGRSIKHGRAILNEAKLNMIAEQVGFEVILFEPGPKTSLSEANGLINSSHAMIGVHGAGLTHLFFMRPGSVFVQIVPIGTTWASKACYGKPAKELGLEYMEYRTEVKESSLVDKYGEDDILLRDPEAVLNGTWTAKIMDKYLREQNVKLDLDRFRAYLKIVYVKAKTFMDNNS